MSGLLSKRPLLAANWKMNLSVEEAERLAAELVRAVRDISAAEVVLIPPFTTLHIVRRVLGESHIRLGAQNMHWEDKGAFTGEISAGMLLQAGCRYVVLGHSERRQLFGETDHSVNRKLKAALTRGLTPIFCLGETLQEREQGGTQERVSSQLQNGLAGLSAEDVSRTVMAYEPVWAIGTGKTATPAQAQEVHGLLRRGLEAQYGQAAASCVIILYGGSVKPDNAFSLFGEKDIDGFLVGGASLEASSFLRITTEAIRAFKEKT